MTTGAFPLTGIHAANLPYVTVANGARARHYSNRKASGAITPGAAVVPTALAAGSAAVNTPGASLKMKVAGSGDAITQLGIALRCVQVPDQNTGPSSIGPNEVMNTEIADGDYVHVYYEGDFWLSLVVPTTYSPGDLVGWDADGARPTGVSGTGAWAKNSAADIDSVFEVMEVRRIGSGSEVMLLVRKL